MDRETTYEMAVRYIFDRCKRFGGPHGAACTSVFSNGAGTGDWKQVAEALADSAGRILSDASQIQWSGEDGLNGGLRPNFEHALKGVGDALGAGSDAAAVYAALAAALHALKALTLKAAGNTPPKYKGE